MDVTLKIKVNQGYNLNDNYLAPGFEVEEKTLHMFTGGLPEKPIFLTGRIFVLCYLQNLRR